MNALRVLLALEFLAGLGAWWVDADVWPLSCVVMTGTLITFLLSWGEDPAPWDVPANICDRGACDEVLRCVDCAPESAP